MFDEGSPKGKLTDYGRLEAAKLGIRRKNEYITGKHLLPIKYNASAVLSLAPMSKQGVFSETGDNILQAMYPMTKLAPAREVGYLTRNSPIRGTSFESILKNMYTPWRQEKVCLSGPVQEVPSHFDNVMLQKTCKNIDRMLTEDKFDTARVEKLLVDAFGVEEVTHVTDVLAKRFEKRAETLREYSSQLEVRIAELSHMLSQDEEDSRGIKAE